MTAVFGAPGPTPDDVTGKLAEALFAHYFRTGNWSLALPELRADLMAAAAALLRSDAMADLIARARRDAAAEALEAAAMRVRDLADGAVGAWNPNGVWMWLSDRAAATRSAR